MTTLVYIAFWVAILWGVIAMALATYELHIKDRLAAWRKRKKGVLI